MNTNRRGWVAEIASTSEPRCNRCNTIINRMKLYDAKRRGLEPMCTACLVKEREK